MITPHAFSPSEFPDEDCPPHFYARGNNPQFRYFGYWSDYANRLCDALYEAKHHAPVAVLYHAEGEWGSYTAEALTAEPFEKAERVLAEHQIDCDVVCINDLTDAKVINGKLALDEESFNALIIPFTPCIDGDFIQILQQFAAGGLPVIFTNSFPTHGYFGAELNVSAFNCCPTQELPSELAARNIIDISCSTSEPDLIMTHYEKDGFDWYLFVNQSTKKSVHTYVTVPDTRNSVFYDAMNDQFYRCEKTVADNSSLIELRLEPWETVFLVFGNLGEEAAIKVSADECSGVVFPSDWEISVATAKDYPTFTKTEIHELVDLSLPEHLPDFAGTVRYDATFVLPSDVDYGGSVFVDISEASEIVEVAVNNSPVGVKLTPPYRFAVPAEVVRAGKNSLTVDVTNTVVKSEHDNVYDRYFVQDPTGITGDVRILFKKDS